MRQTGVYVLASLISGVSAALILASGPSYTESRSPQGTAYNGKRGQSAYNRCRASPCQIAYLNTVEDFCLWAPSRPAVSAARNTEHTLVAWCMKSTHGTRLIPDGTISGARLVITPEYVQITGVGNLSNINVPADGVASASGEGDHAHGLVFTRAYGQLEQIYDWTSFASQERFCFTACRPSAATSTTCPRIYDSFGCLEDAPGNYDAGVFEDCIGDATEVPLTLYQEVLAVPSHHSTRPSSGCMTRGTTSDAQVAPARRAIVSVSDSTSSAPVILPFHLLSRLHGQGTPSTSSITPTTTDTATTITFPSFPTSTSTTASFMSSSTPVSSATPTSTPYSYSYTQTHWRSRTHRHSRHHSSTLSALVSSSSYLSFTRSRSPSPLGDPSTTSSTSLPAPSTPAFTFTFSTFSSSDPSSSATSTSTATPTPTSTSTSTSSFPSSSGGMSSSLSELSSAQPSPSTSSSTATPASSLTPPSIASLISSQSADVLTFTTSLSSSSLPTTSPATSSSTVPISQTQLGSQCPPASQVAVSAGSVVPVPAPLLPLILTILIIIISSFVGVLVP